MKKRSDVAGYHNCCPNFQPCPLCYGCRNYNPAFTECISICGINRKLNICNRERHKPEQLASFITKETVKI